MVVTNKLIVSRKKKDVLIAELIKLKFDKVDDSYDYLMKMPL